LDNVKDDLVDKTQDVVMLDHAHEYGYFPNLKEYKIIRRKENRQIGTDDSDLPEGFNISSTSSGDDVFINSTAVCFVCCGYKVRKN